MHVVIGPGRLVTGRVEAVLVDVDAADPADDRVALRVGLESLDGLDLLMPAAEALLDVLDLQARQQVAVRQRVVGHPDGMARPDRQMALDSLISPIRSMLA
jgi:hypothetical protein